MTTLARGAQLALYDVAHPDTPRRVATGRVDDGWSGSSSPPAVTFLGGRPAVLVTGSDGRRSVLDYSGGDLHSDRCGGHADRPGVDRRDTARRSDGAERTDCCGPHRPLAAPPRALPAAGADAADLVFSADPPALIVARQNGAVDRIDLADPATVHPVAPAPPPEGPTSARPSVALSPRADRMAVSYTAGPTVTVTDLHDPTHVASLTGPFTAGSQSAESGMWRSSRTARWW